MSRSWYSVTLTRAGWDAVRRRTFSRSVPMPAGVMAPCPGDDRRSCLAMTPGGRRCYFCSRPRYRLATTPTLRDTSPIAKGGSDAG